MRTARALHRMALLTATMLALTACDAGQQAVVQTELSADPKTSLMLADDIARSVEIDSLPVQVSGGDRMVIYNANMTVVVSEPLESIENISGLASELGGFDDEEKKHGAWKRYHANGQLWDEGRLDHGKNKGTWRVYDEAGKLLKTQAFK